jgi:hypothetical protein
MVPSRIVFLNDLPYNQGNKIDLCGSSVDVIVNAHDDRNIRRTTHRRYFGAAPSLARYHLLNLDGISDSHGCVLSVEAVPPLANAHNVVSQ